MQVLPLAVGRRRILLADRPEITMLPAPILRLLTLGG
jgi:hypothetical protein